MTILSKELDYVSNEGKELITDPYINEEGYYNTINQWYQPIFTKLQELEVNQTTPQNFFTLILDHYIDYLVNKAKKQGYLY